jgi:hypothetical protein
VLETKFVVDLDSARFDLVEKSLNRFNHIDHETPRRKPSDCVVAAIRRLPIFLDRPERRILRNRVRQSGVT